MKRRVFISAAIGSSAAPLLARAQSWPARPVRFIVPYIPGSAPDTIARQLAERLAPAIGQSVVIENRGGAGGNIGTEMIAKSSPDGYTIGLATSAMVTNPWLYSKTGYDPVSDFTPIHLSISMPHLLVVQAESPARSVADLIRLAREAPGKYNYASAAELFKSSAGIDIVHVPFKGAPEIITSVISGSTLCGFPTLATAVPQVKAGRLRALGVTGTTRNHALPDVAPISDTVAGYQLVSWFGVIGPAKMPSDIAARIESALLRALADPPVRDRVQGDGAEAINQGQQAFAEVIRTDFARMKRTVEIARAKVD
jgi:tripartite-type tricarboxylate transporter receptor subunit TctC